MTEKYTDSFIKCEWSKHIKAQRIFRLKFHKNDLNIGCIHLKYNDIESKRMEEKHFLNGKKGPQKSAPL